MTGKAAGLVALPGGTSGADRALGVIPQELDAERACLGAALGHASLLPALVQRGLQPHHFTGQDRRDLFAAMLELHAEGTPVDVLTVTNRLGGGSETKSLLEDLVADQSSPITNASAHAGIVIETACRRAAYSGAFAIQEAAQHPGGDIQAAFDVVALAIEQATAPHGSGFVSLPEFLAKERSAADPYATRGRSVFLAAGSFLLFVGPSNVGKTLAMLDFAGCCASDAGGECVGLEVKGGLRIGIVALEGTQEDMQDRLASLMPADAQSRISLWDHWDVGRLTKSGVAAWIRREQIDLLVIDTITAFMQELGEDISMGVSEASYGHLLDLRRRSARNFAVVASAHSRKTNTSSNTKVVDQLEETAGTIHKKADAALTFRPEEGQRVKLHYSKCRVGAKPDPIIIELPDEDSAAPPRFSFVAVVGGRPVKQGTEGERIAEFIGAQDAPQPVSVIVAAIPGLNESTLRRRRGELKKLGITHAPMPGQGQTHGYGTKEQWQRVVGERLGEAA